MVHVCDAIMGTGKTSAVITYLNEHRNYKYIYITPYLEEASRIKKGCPSLNFAEPSNKLKQYDFKKSKHTADLIKRGRNITTTHQAFKSYTQETLDDIERQGYILIIDENVDILENFNFHTGDLQLAVDAGYIKEDNDIYSISNKEYTGVALRELFSLLKTRELIGMTDENNTKFYMWTLPPKLLTSFKEVFVLTYLFEGQSIRYLMDIYNIPYDYIGIDKLEDGSFRFGEFPGYVPDYVNNLKEMLNILDIDKMNQVGDEHHALSMNWFKSNPDKVKKLQQNVSNYYNNIWRDIPCDRRLWGSYKGDFSKIKGKGYTKAFLTFNARATNVYGDRDCLVYVTNLFMNVNEKLFYQMHGIEVDEDKYALSIMVQWIWRSAIRNGQTVNLYIPSRRMRTLLIDWIDNTAKGGAQIVR